MKRYIKSVALFMLFVAISFFTKVNAATSTIFVNLENDTISSDGKSYSDIKEYESLEVFLQDYNSGNLPNVYITNFLFDGVSAVKTPDLDDFIENASNDTKIKQLEIKVFNINTTGSVELTGTTKGSMIAVNTNGIKGNIDLILNNVSIDTDSKKAPAIYVYNKETTYTDCKVTIVPKANTKNYIEGGKLKKVSLLASENLENYISYYSNENLENFKNYTSYYGIYNENEVKNILFATVKADSEDLQEGDPYLFYKASGAISSDIDLYFEGEGYLKVTSKNKEGIETKGNLTFSGGIGDYEIYAYDDCLNTTTAKTAGTNIRNAMVIDVNSLIAVVNDEGDEGDAIDSNGTLTINGGTIYAFAHASSQDSGLDSEDGTYINGGKVIATGNMADVVSSSSSQKYIYISFNSKILQDTLITIKDENNNIILAFKTPKTTSTLLYSSSDLSYEKFNVYSGGNIVGDETNGVYTNITSLEGEVLTTYTEANSFGGFRKDNMNNFNAGGINSSNNFIFIMLIVLMIVFVIVIAYIFVDKYIVKKKKQNI